MTNSQPLEIKPMVLQHVQMTQVNSLMRSETEHFYQPNRFGRTLEVAEGRDKLASTEPMQLELA